MSESSFIAKADEGGRADGSVAARGAALARFCAFALLSLAAMTLLPSLYCERFAAPYGQNQEQAQLRVLRGGAFASEQVASGEALDATVQRAGETAMMTYTLTSVAAGQAFLRKPSNLEEVQLIGRTATEHALSPQARQFDLEAWHGEDALLSLDDDSRGHGAYVAYLGLSLGWDRVLRRRSPWVDLHDGLIAALERRMSASQTGVIASYPEEFYPADATVAIAAIELHARLSGRARPAMLDAWEQRFRVHCIDKESGLVYRSLSANGMPSGARGSVSAFAAWMLSSSHPQLAKELYDAVISQRYEEMFGFGMVREYARSDGSAGDALSGPLMLGYSPVATSFALGAARALGDARTFRRLYSTVHLVGMPIEGDARRNFVIAGSLGSAALSAMLLAFEPGEYERLMAQVQP